MKKEISVLLIPLLTGCSTLSESLQLGSSIGAMSGAAATYTAHRSVGETPSFETVATGAAIGLGVGLITSYIVHKNVSDQTNNSDNTEMYFGDLPPSPFVFQNSSKKGTR
jgi:hypothetical protein